MAYLPQTQKRFALLKEKIIKLYNEAKPVADIAKECGITTNRVYQIIKEKDA